MSYKLWIRFAALLLALSASAWAQDSGTAVKPDDIKAEPFKDAKTVGAVKKGEVVSILKKQGGWMQIKAGAVSGWVRVLSVRKGSGGPGAAAEIAGVAGVATGRAGTGQVVSTTGVRGLSADELKNARYDEEELKRAEANAIAADEAKAFAEKGELQARQVSWLPATDATAVKGR
ncbi:MAG: SH3 domain-containing protein [Betaproteobacteria bacterium]|nr:SH3 domain-containing protein [Betaproteobacteria bacterium]